MPFVYDLGAESPPIVYESGDFAGGFERLLATAGYDTLCAERDRRRAAGEHVGIGVAATVELGAIGPFEDATVTVGDDGTVVVRVGVASLGQGVETVLAQIAADELGVDARRASRSTTTTRPTSRRASARSPAGQRWSPGTRSPLACRRAPRTGTGAKGSRSPRPARCPAGSTSRTRRSRSGRRSRSSRSIRETGRVVPERHVVLHDVGRAINPALVEGQLAGGAVQGVAGALLEELPYDETGQPLALSLADYRLPTVLEAPPVEVVLVEGPVPGNPLGVKGAGEAGIVGAPAAVANAVADALPPGSDEPLTLPLTPQRVHALARPARPS